MRARFLPANVPGVMIMLEQMKQFLQQSEERAKHWRQEWVRLEAERKRTHSDEHEASRRCNKWQSIVDDLKYVIEQEEGEPC